MIIKNSDATSKNAKINKFFKDMSSGKLGGKDLNFSVFVNNIKRKYMMDNFLSNQEEEKQTGKRIFRNVSDLHEYQKSQGMIQPSINIIWIGKARLITFLIFDKKLLLILF